MTNPLISFRRLRGLLAAALVVPGSLALAVDPAPPLPPPADGLGAITSLIGDAECDNAGQCRAVGIGAKPCGGPSGYLAWSTKQTDPDALRAAVDAQAAAQKEDAKSRGLMSDCRLIPEPPVSCRPRASDGRKTCQLGQGGVRSAV